MVDRLLVPTDGSGPATAALELALAIATATTTVSVLSVVEGSEGSASRPGPAGRTAEEILAEARSRPRTSGTTLETAVRRGPPRERILEYAEREAVDLIVVGAHGRRETEPLVVGRVTEGVVRDAPVPVLVVRASDDVRRRYPFERVLVPTDGSAHATAALEHGIETAAETGATLHLLSVVTATEYGNDPETQRLLERLAESARDLLESAAERTVADGLDVRTAVRTGSVHREITAYAEREDVDLLVMGTRGRTADGGELLGSVTERVLRTAPAPVLTVRAAGADEH
ncbi:universal stress protein [Natronococcus sp.]|uniref:universal stress protein n=1 Tax=Natronococcus sp. TaxID=35747 RepID=UPI003A4DAF09